MVIGIALLVIATIVLLVVLHVREYNKPYNRYLRGQDPDPRD